MFDDLIVIFIFFAAILYIGKRIYGVFFKRDIQCGCGSSDDCSGCTVSKSLNCMENKDPFGSAK